MGAGRAAARPGDTMSRGPGRYPHRQPGCAPAGRGRSLAAGWPRIGRGPGAVWPSAA